MVCTGVFNFIARLGFCDSKEGINGCLTNCSSNNFECYSTCYRTNGWLPPLSTAEKIVYPTTAAILLLLSLVVACMMSTTLGIDMSSLQAAIDGIDSVIRKQASKVVGLRKKGSLLLTSLLIASTGLNVAFTVFIADILGLLLGFIACTFLILVFVEILPPAICAYDALWIAASTAWFGKILIVILFPISYPLSLILDSYLLRRQDDDDDDGDGDSSSRGGCMYLFIYLIHFVSFPHLFLTLSFLVLFTFHTLLNFDPLITFTCSLPPPTLLLSYPLIELSHVFHPLVLIFIITFYDDAVAWHGVHYVFRIILLSHYHLESS